MKLSEAIRLGAMDTPQAFYETRDHKGGTCAMGAALHAIGVVGRPYSATIEFFPLALKAADHPLRRDDDWIVISIIRDLNDEYKWSRQRIADWVETIEATVPSADASVLPDAVAHPVGVKGV
jgi:hypothetical protein